MTLLLSLGMASTASGAGVLDNYPHQVLIGTPVTFTYAPAPATAIPLTWEVSDHPTLTTACAQATPAGCQYAAQWNTAGLKNVCVNRGPENVCWGGAAQLTVITPVDLLTPIVVTGLEAPTMKTPITAVVYTTQARLTFGWTSSGMFGNYTPIPLGKQGAYNKFKVKILTPPGVVNLAFSASSGGQEYHLDFSRVVTAFTGPTYGEFGLKLTEQLTKSRFHAAGRLTFMSIKRAKWSLTTRLDQRVEGKWKKVAQKKSSGKDLGGDARYEINTYGKTLKVKGQTWKSARSACKSGRKLRVIMKAEVTKLSGKRIWSRTLSRGVKKSACMS